MAELTVSVISPEKILYEGEASAVTLPGQKGEFMVLKDHAPLVSMLDPGLVSIRTEKGKKVFVVDGGFCEVEDNQVSALVEGASSVDEINPEEEQAALDELLKKGSASDEEYKKTSTQIRIHRAKLRVAAESN